MILPFGAEKMSHLSQTQLLYYLEPYHWIERFNAIHCLPENENIVRRNKTTINIYRLNVKTGSKEWITKPNKEAIVMIIKNDILNVYNEVRDLMQQNKVGIQDDALLYGNLNSAYVVQRFTKEDIFHENNCLDFQEFLKNIPNKINLV